MASFLVLLFLGMLSIASCGTPEMREPPSFLYKVTTKELWNESQQLGFLALAPLDADFIHLSEEEEVGKVIAKFFPSEKSVVVLKLQTSQLQGKLVKEKNPGGTKEYYHLYNGVIPLDSVVDVKIEVK